ncbi:MAG TPA: glycosyl hydrolase, partial [Spirochaetaceae bacterium]|nr:glycosyl hydrolase [Spirochaetaceae bacterium]
MTINGEEATLQAKIGPADFSSFTDGAAINTIEGWAAVIQDETFTVDIQSADNAGNIGITSASFTKDIVGPTVASVVFVDDSLTVAGPSSLVTITFSEPVTGFTIADLAVDNGTLSTFAGSGATYTVTFTASANTEAASNGFQVGSAYIDAAGNSGSVGSAAYSIDTKAPTVTSVLFDDSNLNVAGPSSLVTIIFSQDVTGFTVGDISAPNGALSAFSGSGATYTVTFTASANTEAASNSFQVGSAYIDAAGNSGSVGSSTYSVDTKTPSVASIVFTDNSLNVAGPSSLVTITFSEPVTGFTVGDISAPNGALSAFSGSGASYTVTFTATANTEAASNSFQVGSDYSDAVGNSGNANSTTYSIDTVAPTVASIVFADDSLTVAGPSSLVTITFSEPVTGLAVGDLTAPNGTLSAFDGTGTTYTVTFTATANTEAASNSFQVGSGYIDAAGNNGSVDSAAYSIETKAPTVASLVFADNSLNVAGPSSL